MVTEKQIAVAVMATEGGTSTASRSNLLQPLGGKPILHHVLDNISRLQVAKTFVVVGLNAEEVIASLEDRGNIQFVQIVEQSGAVHLIQQLMPLLEGFQGDLIVMDGSIPLLRAQRLTSLIEYHRHERTSATIITSLSPEFTKEDLHFYSCDDHTVHHLTALRYRTRAEQIRSDINVGVSCFRWPDLMVLLQTRTPDHDVDVHRLYERLYPWAMQCVEAYEEFFRIKGNKELAAAYKILQKRRKEEWMLRGVTFLDPDSATIDDAVVIGENVIIEPQTHLRGKTTIGDGCCIGPGTFVENSQIGARCKVRFSVVSDSTVANETWIGPYTHLRANAQLGEGCRVGNFVEIKNASLGKSTFAAHLSYLGDAELGNNVNIGAGTITANFDGFKKHKTMIHDGAKTGANSVLVAPITIGSQVTVGAGSTVTEDVNDEALVVARARQVVKPDWKPKPK